jgi:hypothetical protein
VSNSGLSSNAPEKLLAGKMRYTAPVCLPSEERRERVAISDEEGVVQEGLADKQREAQQRMPRVERETERAISTIPIERRCRTVTVKDGSGSW